MKFGSHLYGTATPESDLDIKEVHIPGARDILLGRAKETINRQAKTSVGGHTRKNTAGDTDFESYSLAKFLRLFCEGQTVALDMLFATPLLKCGADHDFSEEWAEIWDNRHRLVSRQCAPFLGYCRKQAAKYGIKGSRVAAARGITNLLASFIEKNGPIRKLSDFAWAVESFTHSTEHAGIEDIENPGNGAVIRHLVVCERKAPFTVSLKEAHAIYKRIVDEYGERALQAERNEGIDWKALSHAVRVGTQCLEYLSTGFVTFPRPDAAHLIEIKTGKLAYAPVAEEIERLLAEVEAAAIKSTLPEKPDYEWCDDFVADVYREVVING
jgi:hypothetical protein